MFRLTSLIASLSSSFSLERWFVYIRISSKISGSLRYTILIHLLSYKARVEWLQESLIISWVTAD